MKNIVITGATSGIGLAFVKKIAQRSDRILVLGRKENALQQLQAELGENLRFAVCDIRDYAEVLATSEKAMVEWGRVDVLINNAGLGYFDPFAQGKIEEWHEMFDLNVKGLLNAIHAFLPHLLESSGQIINIGSVGSHHVFPNTGVYCATKHAVFAISESLRLELPDKIRVTTISPGSVNTPFIEKTTNPEMLKQYMDYFAGGLSPDVVADQIIHAMDAPTGSVVSEIVIRPARISK